MDLKRKILQLTTSLVIFSYLIVDTFAAEDQRCRCVCPRLKTFLNSSQLVINGVDYTNTSVYIRKNVGPEACDCVQTLNYKLPSLEGHIEDLDEFCLRCECKFEQRNSTTQKVVIIFVIVVFGLMFIYGLFIMCLDPIMNRRRTTYRRTTEDMAEEIPADQPLPGVSGNQASRRVTAAVNRVRAQQEKWKGQVSEQRQNIYTKHKILA